MFPPVEFSMTVNYGGKTITVDRFSNFVTRSIEITAEQAEQITTAIVVDADGMVRHVPTCVEQRGGKWYAVINSLTNSVYVLINNKTIFTDAQSKWYEAAVNEID